MATVNIVFASAMDGITPVLSAAVEAAEAITSSGTSQQSANACTRQGQVVSITADAGAVWVKVGNNPTAAAGSDWLIPAGATREFGRLFSGDKVAVIDV